MSEKNDVIHAWETFMRSGNHWDATQMPVLRLPVPSRVPVTSYVQSKQPTAEAVDVVEVTRRNVVDGQEGGTIVVGRIRDTTVILSGPGCYHQ